MIVGVGIDLAKVERFKKLLLNDGFLTKYYHSSEIDYIKSKGESGAQSMAARFAAREAFFKALGTGFSGFNLKDIRIDRDEKGRPIIVTGEKVKSILDSSYGSWRVHLSLSHEKEYAIAQVILEA